MLQNEVADEIGLLLEFVEKFAAIDVVERQMHIVGRERGVERDYRRRRFSLR